MKKTTHSIRRLLVLVLVLVLGMFSMIIPVQAEDGSLSAKDRAELLAKASISCDATGGECTAGNIDTGDFLNVTINGDCFSNAYYGRIDNKAVDARDKVATTGTNAKTIAELPANQLVCILATAAVGRGNGDIEQYVMALPWDYDATCTENVRCRLPLPKPESAAMLKCKADHEAKRYNNCPQGWVFAKDMEAYPMGLPGMQ
ncbi:hypothetical protein NIBR502774_14220 (plasmid) [Rhizobium sp. NIBRBAC000502774]|nr:hypothetical protein NIBR502774_14220 [Rhizobium sp. NIBRBAC000502774]